MTSYALATKNIQPPQSLHGLGGIHRPQGQEREGICEGDFLLRSDGAIREVAFKSGIFGNGDDFDFHQIWADDVSIGNPTPIITI